jgi:hypothetical protein
LACGYTPVDIDTFAMEKAREMGIDWWTTSPYLNAKLAQEQPQTSDLLARMARLEAALPSATKVQLAVDSAVDQV